MFDKVSLATEVNQLHADICAALADPRRILMLYLLAQNPINVSDLAREVGISQPATSRHLKILRDCGLIFPMRLGASVEYHLTDPRLIQALDLLRAVLRDRISHRASLMETSIS